MNDENQVSEPQTEVVETTNESQEVVEETHEETVEEVRERLAKAEELANNYKVRAEKAEQASKKDKPQELSQTDMLAVLREGLDDDDITRAVKFAKLEGVTVAKALQSDFMKSYIETKKEQKKSAAAANTGKGKGGSSKLSDSALIEKARNSVDLSQEEMDRLWMVRKGLSK